MKSGIVVDITCDQRIERIWAFALSLRQAVFLKDVPGWGALPPPLGIKVHSLEGKDE